MAVVYYTDPEYVERLDGRDYPKVTPKSTHAFVQLAFAMLLRRCIGDRGKVLPELRCRIGSADGTDSHLVPDIAVIAIERWRSLATERDREEPPFAPDVAIEIRSPGQSARLRERKTARYLATGAQLVLDVDPRARAINAYDADGVRRFASGERFADARFPWLTFDVAEVFADLDE